MCDFSLKNVRSRPAKVGDKLVTRDFGTGTRGFAAADDPGLAVCVMPGTELAFAQEIACVRTNLFTWKARIINHQTAIFRQVNKERSASNCRPIVLPAYGLTTPEQKWRFIEPGDIEAAMQTASAIGDDRLQRYVVPDAFTHGSSEQRVRWFANGLRSGQVASCDTYQVTEP
jgi:hypothetical protein